ncbi:MULTISPECIES: FecR domain-containing protein [unclassified Pseudoalteromonas]|uniref:FecR family protein n=1 Tax=unclassified Pseudoalteromonas TaxID=194690 RepID=UPI0025B3989B|nr:MULTISPECIES: FecR domain-containing protein [unclassified Pseudoalteromonas]MDN3379504.1 FecR domain-containing protein [Pseudoalteromonas sp. APC 3893]MDN3387844.1 FecR domain-containing protein [Pseudoalteromonas sp. APC 4017]
MNNQDTDKRLQREAYNLVAAAYNDPNSQSQLNIWRKQSVLHEDAATQAEANWALLGLVENAPLSLFDKFKLTTQIQLERLSETPARLLPTAVAAMVCIIFVFLGLDFSSPKVPQTKIVQTIEKPNPVNTSQRYQTGWAEQRKVTLEDGTEVWLDWNTELEVSMTDAKRQVALVSGKALFSVVSDPNRPFSVVSEQVEARVLGTQFVFHKLDEQAVEIEVLKGAVGVNSEKAQVMARLAKNDVIRITSGELGDIKTRTLAEIGAWRDGIIVFEQRPLIEALEVLQSYTSFELDTRFIYEADRLVSGTFVLNKGDEALRAIMQGYRLTGKVQGRNTLVLRSLPPERPF